MRAPHLAPTRYSAPPLLDSVHQLSILEVESTGQGTPQGVVLALVGPEIEFSREQEGTRSLRMYNLASLVSLAKWSISRKVCYPSIAMFGDLKQAAGSATIRFTGKRPRQASQHFEETPTTNQHHKRP